MLIFLFEHLTDDKNSYLEKLSACNSAWLFEGLQLISLLFLLKCITLCVCKYFESLFYSFRKRSGYLQVICQCLEGKQGDRHVDGPEMIQTHAEASTIMCVR